MIQCWLKVIEIMPEAIDSKSAPSLIAVTRFSARLAAAYTLRSTTLCLLASLILVYSLSWKFCPWRELAEVDISPWIIEFAGRSADFATKEPRQDAAIFGTSLIAAAASRFSPGSKVSASSSSIKDVYAIFIANLEHSLCARSGAPVKLAMAAVPGSMVSDQYFLLKEAVGQKRAPSLLILTLAPRDFIDNEVGLRVEETPLRRVLSFLSSNRHFFPPSLSAQGWQLCLESHRRFFSLIQKRVRRALVLWACAVLHREENLWSSQQRMLSNKNGQSDSGLPKAPAIDAATSNKSGQISEKISQSNALADDLRVYRRRYLPLNQALYSMQCNYLNDLLTLAKHEKIGVVVFLMPLSSENRRLLPNGWLNQFSLNCKKQVAQFGFDIYDLNEGVYQSTFQRSDFVDSVHLSLSGAEKFYSIFVEKLLKSPTAAKSLNATQR